MLAKPSQWSFLSFGVSGANDTARRAFKLTIESPESYKKHLVEDHDRVVHPNDRPNEASTLQQELDHVGQAMTASKTLVDALIIGAEVVEDEAVVCYLWQVCNGPSGSLILATENC